jgi:hypothetical protein
VGAARSMRFFAHAMVSVNYGGYPDRVLALMG